MKYMGESGMVLPPAWTGPAVHESNTMGDVGGSEEDFLRMEDQILKSWHASFVSEARARKIFATTRTAGLKLVWFAMSRRWVWPPGAVGGRHVNGQTGH